MTLNSQQSVLDRIKAKVYVAYQENSHGLSGRESATVTGSQARALIDELYAALCPPLDADAAAEIDDLLDEVPLSLDDKKDLPFSFTAQEVRDYIARTAAIFQRQSAQPGSVDERVKALVNVAMDTCQHEGDHGDSSYQYTRDLLAKRFTKALKFRTPATSDKEARVEELERYIGAIKALVVGDKHPRWSDDLQTSMTRGGIADICDTALPTAPTQGE